jgi:hypothetical protein
MSYFRIEVEFIDGNYFRDVEAKDFTINEASKVLDMEK